MKKYQNFDLKIFIFFFFFLVNLQYRLVFVMVLYTVVKANGVTLII